MAPHNLIKSRKEIKGGRASGILNFPCEKDTLFTQIFQTIFKHLLETQNTVIAVTTATRFGVKDH